MVRERKWRWNRSEKNTVFVCKGYIFVYFLENNIVLNKLDTPTWRKIRFFPPLRLFGVLKIRLGMENSIKSWLSSSTECHIGDQRSKEINNNVIFKIQNIENYYIIVHTVYMNKIWKNGRGWVKSKYYLYDIITDSLGGVFVDTVNLL